MSIFDTTELTLNMGPQHPSTHGVLRVVLRLDGERVVGCDVVIGYLHRGIEKLCEHRDWQQIVLITDRMDYVAAASNNLGYVETVEKLILKLAAAYYNFDGVQGELSTPYTPLSASDAGDTDNTRPSFAQKDQFPLRWL